MGSGVTLGSPAEPWTGQGWGWAGHVVPTLPWALTVAVAADEVNSCCWGHQGQGAGIGLGLLGAAGP